MAENEKFADQKLSEDDLDQVAGGSWEDFNYLCKALGKKPAFTTRDGLRSLLAAGGVSVDHWNTGDRGSKNEGAAEFTALRDITINVKNADTDEISSYVISAGNKMDVNQVKACIT